MLEDDVTNVIVVFTINFIIASFILSLLLFGIFLYSLLDFRFNNYFKKLRGGIYHE